ncbi:MAG TPA: DnaB-like helicase C-terminal domain-containing protein [Ktedonobacteraceae bacterium]|nr:DnaB-like helicase C-terminal domain-containing protein [Ktedonobacteraceae bacterium]
MEQQDAPLPLQDEACERRLLGALLTDGALLAEITAILTPDDWWVDHHRFIFEVIVYLAYQQTMITSASVADALQQQGLLETIGGTAYLSELTKQQKEAPLVDARHLRQLAYRRRLSSLGRQLIALAHHEPDVKTILNRAKGLLATLSPAHGLLSLHDLIEGYRPLVQELRSQAGTIRGVPTGFMDVDRLTGGLQPSTLVVVASPPNVGKTTFAFSLLLNTVTRYRRSVGLFSLERNGEQVIERLLTMSAKIERHQLLISQLEDAAWEELSFSLDQLAKTNIWLDDTADLSLDLLKERAQWMVSVAKVDVLIIDSVGLLYATINGRRYDNHIQEVEEISRSLKVLARTLNVPILVLMQVSRQIGYRDPAERHSSADREAPTPRLSDLRNGSFENDADLVIFLSRDDVLNPKTERKNLVDLIVAKHRDGPLGEMTLYCPSSSYYLCDLSVSAPEGGNEESS